QTWRGVGRAWRRLGRVARAEEGGIDEFIGFIRGYQDLRVAQLDLDVVAREDVRNVHAEDVRPLLLQQRRAFSLALSLLKLFLRRFAFLDLSDDDIVADRHFHAVNRRPGRQRKDIAPA